MWSAASSNTQMIYVPLLDEGTTVVRPTQGAPLGGGLYRVLATSGYDPNDEHWEFPPGSVVRCVPEVRGGDRIMVARELVVTR